MSPGQVHHNFYLSCYQITCPCQGKINYQCIFYLSTGHCVKIYACPAWNSTCPGHQDKWFFYPWNDIIQTCCSDHTLLDTIVGPVAQVVHDKVTVHVVQLLIVQGSQGVAPIFKGLENKPEKKTGLDFDLPL